MRPYPSFVCIFVLPIILLGGCGDADRNELTANGTPTAVGQTARGFQTGEWSYFYADGAPKAKGSWGLKTMGAYKEDIQVGLWEAWYEDGTPKRRGDYAMGLREGWWTYWHANGKPSSAGAYIGDKQDGLWRYWDDTGVELAVGVFDHGGRALWWRLGNAEGLFFGGSKVGPWTDAQGKITDHGVPAGFAVQSVAGTYWGMENKDASQRLLVRLEDGRPKLAVQVHGTQTLFMLADAGGSWVVGREQAGQQTGYLWLRSEGPAGEFLNGLTATGQHPVWRIKDGARVAISAEDLANDPSTALFLQAIGDGRREARAEVHDSLQQRPKESTVVMPDKTVKAELATAMPEPDLPELSPVAEPPEPFTPMEQKRIKRSVRVYATNGDFAGGDYDREEKAPTFEPDAIGEGWIGKPLTQTRFLGAKGRVIDLADRQGQKTVVLVILRGFAGSICPYCTAQTRAMSNGAREFEEAGAEVVYLYPGSASAVPKFVASVKELGEQKLPPLTFLLDLDLQFIKSIGIEGHLAKPTSIVVGKDGLVKYAYVGKSLIDRPSVKRLLTEVRADGKGGP